MILSVDTVVVICAVLVFCGVVSVVWFSGSIVGVTLVLILIDVVVVAVESDVALRVDTISVVELPSTVDSVVVLGGAVVTRTDSLIVVRVSVGAMLEPCVDAFVGISVVDGVSGASVEVLLMVVV